MEGHVDGSTDRIWGFDIRWSDLDFLKADYLREGPSVEAGAKGMLEWEGFCDVGSRGRVEEVCDWLCSWGEKWGDAIDIP